MTAGKTPGVTAGDRFRSWADIQANAARAASGLAALGVGEDSSVALMLRNDFPTFEANMAASQLGAYPVPINWHYTPEEAGYILQDCGAEVLVVHADLLAQIAAGVPANVKVLVVPTPPEIAAAYNVPPEKAKAPAGAELWQDFVAAAPPRTDPPKLARGSMIYTSGTTGRPKGVRRRPSTPEQQAASAAEAATFWGLKPDPDAVALMNGPMYHSAPAAYAMASARLGLHIVLQARFEAEDMLRLIDKHRVSHMHIVPTMFVRLLRLPQDVRQRYDVSSLRFITHGAAPCAPAVKRQMIEWWGPVINEYYGATETGVVVWHGSADALRKPGTVGRLVPGGTLRIVDEEGQDVKQGEAGEIYVRGPNLAEVTYNNDEAKRKEVGLGDLVLEKLGATLKKEHQQADFSVRPLPAELRAYIADDVRYLTELGRMVKQACVDADILEEVWGMDAFPTDRTVDNFIMRLRRLFETNPEEPRHLVTLRGRGYLFKP